MCASASRHLVAVVFETPADFHLDPDSISLGVQSRRAAYSTRLNSRTDMRSTRSRYNELAEISYSSNIPGEPEILSGFE